MVVFGVAFPQLISVRSYHNGMRMFGSRDRIVLNEIHPVVDSPAW